jgi:hypothetical protein
MTETDQAEMPAADAIPETEVTDSSTVPEETVEVTPEVEGDDTTPEPEAKKPHWSQKRIDELTRNWRQEQREKQQLLEMLQQQKPVEAPRAVEVKLPTLEEHGYDEAKYQAALLEYADRRAEAVVERRLTEAEQKRTEQTRVETFVTRQKEFAKATPDFEDKVLRDPTLPINSTMRDVIVDSPTGPEMAYYLASNREVAEQIASLPPHLAALEMGRIEGRLSALKEVKTRPAPVVSKAPPPPPKVEDVPVEVEKDPESMSVDEWMRMREKQILKKRK